MPDVAASLLPYLLTLVQGRKNVPKSQFTHLWKESALRSFDPPPQTRLRAPPGPRQAPRTVLTLPAPSCLGCW